MVKYHFPLATGMWFWTPINIYCYQHNIHALYLTYGGQDNKAGIFADFNFESFSIFL